jgi:hypothetical protein
VRAETFRVLPEVAGEVVERVAAEPGVTSATVSPITGSVLVLYDPHKTQVLPLLRTIVVTGGLAGLAVDHVAPTTGDPPGDRVRGLLGRLDDRVREVASGRIDLRTAVPATLAVLGLNKLLTGVVREPEWYDLIFWSFVTFSNLNPRPERAGGAPPPRGHDGGRPPGPAGADG